MTVLITDDGVVTRWHAKAAYRLLVLDFLIAKFEAGRDYSEREVNDILKRHQSFGDWALLRRELFESGRFFAQPCRRHLSPHRGPVRRLFAGLLRSRPD